MTELSRVWEAIELLRSTGSADKIMVLVHEDEANKGMFDWAVNTMSDFITTIESQNKVIDDLEEERDLIQRDYDSACEMSTANNKEALRLYDIVESQKEEMAQLEKSIRYLIATTDNEMEDVAYHKVLELMNPLVQSRREDYQSSQIESLKAITELAVKCLKNIVASGNECMKRDLKVHAQQTLSEIERLKNE